VTATRVVHVVEDDASMRTSLARLLDGEGYGVALYASAEELLAVAGPALAGCILLDLRLPARAASSCRSGSSSGAARRRSCFSPGTATCPPACAP